MATRLRVNFGFTGWIVDKKKEQPETCGSCPRCWEADWSRDTCHRCDRRCMVHRTENGSIVNPVLVAEFTGRSVDPNMDAYKPMEGPMNTWPLELDHDDIDIGK